MKNITRQYQDLLEGKMTKANFMVNVRRDFPQWIVSTNSYQDAVSILKSKRIISENIFNTPQMGGILSNWKSSRGNDQVEQDIKDLLARGNSYEEAIEYIAAEQGIDAEELAAKYPRDVVDIEGHEGNDDDEFADMEKRHNMEKDAEDAKLSQWDYMGEGDDQSDKWLKSVKNIVGEMQYQLSSAVYGKVMTQLQNRPEEVVSKFGKTSAEEAAKMLVASHTTSDEYDPGPGEDAKLSQWDYMGEGSAQITPKAIEVALKNMWQDDLINDVTWEKASEALPTFDIDGNTNMVGTSTADDLARELVFFATGNHVPDVVDYDKEEYNRAAADDFDIDMRVNQDLENRFNEMVGMRSTPTMVDKNTKINTTDKFDIIKRNGERIKGVKFIDMRTYVLNGVEKSLNDNDSVEKSTVNEGLLRSSQKINKQAVTEISMGLAAKTLKSFQDKGFTGDEHEEERGEQRKALEKYINPALASEIKKLGFKNVGGGGDNVSFSADTLPVHGGGKATVTVSKDKVVGKIGGGKAFDLMGIDIYLTNAQNAKIAVEKIQQDYQDLKSEAAEPLNEAIVHEFDSVNYIQLMKGMEFELLQMPEVTDENLIKAKVKAYKNLVKDPKAYMDLIITNTDAVEKIDKGLRTQEVKKDNLVDKANAMKVLKKDEKANTQTNQSNKERARGLPKGVKIVKESVAQRLKENILEEYFEIGEPRKKFAKGESVVTPEGEIGVIEEMTPDNTAEIKLSSGKVVHKQGNVLKPHVEKHVDEYKDNTGFERWSSEKRGKELAAAEIKQANNKAGETFNIGDVVVAPDGIEVKITGFMKGKDDRMKAMYNAGMYSDVYDLDALEKKNSFRGGVDLGKSFDKFKSLKEKLTKSIKKELEEVGLYTLKNAANPASKGMPTVVSPDASTETSQAFKNLYVKKG